MTPVANNNYAPDSDVAYVWVIPQTDELAEVWARVMEMEDEGVTHQIKDHLMYVWCRDQKVQYNLYQIFSAMSECIGKIRADEAYIDRMFN